MSTRVNPEQERRERIKSLLGEVQSLTSEIDSKAGEMRDLLTVDDTEVGNRVGEDEQDAGTAPNR